MAPKTPRALRRNLRLTLAQRLAVYIQANQRCRAAAKAREKGKPMLSPMAAATLRGGLLFPVCVFAFLSGCGPHHQHGGSGGEAGEGEGGAETAGTGGAATAGSSGAAAGGSSGAATGGSSSNSPSFPDDVIGCQAATWPEAGTFVLAPIADEFATPEELLLARMRSIGISGDGTLVVGTTSNPPTRALAVSWDPSAPGASGLKQLPPVVLNDYIGLESTAIQASCDGSVILQKDAAPFGEIYRTEGDEPSPVVLIGSPFIWFVSMNPDGSVITNGRGIEGEFGANPQRWTAANGLEELPSLHDQNIYGVHPDGTLIAGNVDELFEYDVATDSKTPIGMAVADFSPWQQPSIKIAASGEAWAQSADAHHDSFLVWRPPAEPRSITCTGGCEIIDVSGTAQVVLLDVSNGSSSKSVLWTQATGFIDLTEVVQQMGVSLGSQQLRAVAISDDGRAVTGYTDDPTATYYTRRLFYAVLPAAIYQ